MIVGAAVVPGAPFLVPGVADPVAARSTDLVVACGRAVRVLSGADLIVLVTAGRGDPAGRVLPSGTTVSGSSLRRSDLADPKPGPSGHAAVGSIVGHAVLARARPDDVPARVEIVETGEDPVEAAALITGLITGRVAEDRVALLVVADGAACHGDHAPGGRDDRSAGFDDVVAGALAAGDPAALARACADRDLARRLLAVTDPLLVLAELTAADPPAAADLLYRGTPYGVGYLVATWRWSPR